MSEFSDYHTLDIKESAQRLETSIENGLTTAEVQIRAAKYGTNELVGDSGVSAFKVLIRQFLNIMVFILIAAGVLSLVVKDYAESSVVFIIIILNAGIGFFQEYRAEKTVDSLRKLTSPDASVLRDSKIVTIKTSELVPGDVIFLEAGDVIGADIRLFNVFNFESDEALLTGETLPVSKNANIICEADMSLGDRINLGYSSTISTKGRSQGIVYATGMNTEVGKIAEKLMSAKTSTKTKLNRSLDRMALVLLGVALILVVVVFAANKFKINSEVLLYAVSLSIAVIPEGLMAVVTLTMALGVRQMSKQQALVRQLNSIETLGSVTDICSDKTGTLTQSKMVLVRAWIPNDGLYYVDGLGFEPIGEIRKINASNESSDTINRHQLTETVIGDDNVSPALNLLLTNASLCNLSEIKRDDDGEWIGIGDPTEIALQVFATKIGFGKPSLTTPSTGYKTICEFAFDSSVKRMTVVVESPSGEVFALMKGASERVVDGCSFVFNKDGNSPVKPSDFINTLEPHIEKMADDGLRVISLAYKTLNLKELPVNADEWDRDDIERDMNYLGMVGIYDPPRPESRMSVEQCFQAGIVVRMLTGDHPITAAAIARQVGIIPELSPSNTSSTSTDIVVKPLVMIAKDFDSLSQKEIDDLPQLPSVIARCTPETKVKLIEALHRRKAIVAMTGDGVNDSPSLKFADVGIAMGLTGSDVAKQASEIILTDDNFSTIVKAVAEGRRMFTNIRKFSTELIGSNIAELVCLTVGLAFKDINGNTVFPLSPVAILTNNMLTGTPPAMALGIEKALPDNMSNPPRNIKHSLFSYEVNMDILVNGSVIGGLSIMSYWLVINVFGDGNLGENCNLRYSESCELVFRARGVNFANLTLLILLFAYSCRDTRRQTLSIEKLKGIYDNKALFYSYIFAWVITLMSLYIPGLNRSVFKQSPITWEWWLVFVSFVIYLLFDAFYKFLKSRFLPPLYTPNSTQKSLMDLATKMNAEKNLD
ncbi:Calcium-transporting ATPase 3 [Smittium culicis]|uniref:P-type Na(+) transporter n=1 Tax=Smittium culicis TaxID=133412 RepID=A0A1R1YNC5_9FUNG|nr:Calcium-transporting ATPase 3 [Smittium culicis]